jgi:hypothetical protein
MCDEFDMNYWVALMISDALTSLLAQSVRTERSGSFIMSLM